MVHAQLLSSWFCFENLHIRLQCGRHGFGSHEHLLEQGPQAGDVPGHDAEDRAVVWVRPHAVVVDRPFMLPHTSVNVWQGRGNSQKGYAA